MQDKKILQITPQFPFPLDSGGKIGINNTLKAFYKNNFEVYLFSFTRFSLQEDWINEVAKYCKPIIYHKNTFNTIPKILYYTSLGKPIATEKFYDSKVVNKILGLIESNKIDYVHIDHSTLGRIGLELKARTGIPVGVFLHNVEYVIWQRYSESYPKYSPQHLILKKQAQLLKNYEKEIISKVDICFALTPQDLERAKQLSENANVVYIPFGIDLEFFTVDTTIERNPYEIVYATTYDWLPNLNGIKWFLEKAFPLVLKKEPKVKLTLIGKNPPEYLKKYKNVEVLGWVPAIQPYYNRANLSISPLFSGGGVRVKILESMAMELPVVSTYIGAEGIEATNEDGLLLANSHEDFAEKILYLIHNFDKARQLGQNARRFIETHHNLMTNYSLIPATYRKL